MLKIVVNLLLTLFFKMLNLFFGGRKALQKAITQDTSQSVSLNI